MNKNPLSLPANRAFVVQLRDDAKPEQGDFRGRVEHPASMEAMRFTSVEELLAFMRRALSAQELAEMESVQEDEV
jgi:hypothetical protein